MIVIVETTFIVEIVLEKGEAPACEQILGLTAPTGEATLVAPAFCLAEAGMMLERRQGERKRLVSDLAERAKNERGSKVHAKYARALEELASELLRINDVEDQRFVTLSQDQIDGAEIIPLTKSITDEAIMWRQTGFMKSYRMRSCMHPFWHTSKASRPLRRSVS